MRTGYESTVVITAEEREAVQRWIDCKTIIGDQSHCRNVLAQVLQRSFILPVGDSHPENPPTTDHQATTE